jgi:hypothetical protein
VVRRHARVIRRADFDLVSLSSEVAPYLKLCQWLAQGSLAEFPHTV